MGLRDTVAALPASIEDQAYFDPDTKVLSVDKRIRWNPVLLSWISSRTNEGYIIDVKSVDPGEVSRLRAGRAAPEFATAIDDSFRRRARDVLAQAAQYGASDVQLRIRESDAVIYFQINDRLREAERVSATEGKRFSRAWYQGVAEVSDTSYLESEFQNAQIPGKVFLPDSGIDAVRIARGPCYPQHYRAEFMTLRVLYKGEYKVPGGPKILPYPEKPPGYFRLPEMGFTESNIEKLSHLLSCPSGLVLFTGPTGSGKTTSIFQFLEEHLRQKPYLNIVTLEDPPEIPILGTVQIPVVNARNADATADAIAQGVRIMLRMAPNVVMIGEIRDGAVAEAAFEAAITGKKVVSTTHVDEAFEFVDRFELMGRGSATLNRKVMCDPRKVRGVITQRLIPHLCDECAIPLKEAQRLGLSSQVPERTIKALSAWGSLDKVRVLGHGCDKCGNTGIKGRYAIAEVVVTDTELMQDYIKHGTAVARRNFHQRPDADPPMLYAAIDQCLAGNIEPIEAAAIDIIPLQRDPLFRPTISSLS